MDELLEMLTLVQTKKLDREVHILLYGSAYWNDVIHFDSLVTHGMIDAKDLNLIHRVDDVETAFELLKSRLPKEPEEVASPAIANARFSKSSYKEKI